MGNCKSHKNTEVVYRLPVFILLNKQIKNSLKQFDYLYNFSCCFGLKMNEELNYYFDLYDRYATFLSNTPAKCTFVDPTKNFKHIINLFVNNDNVDGCVTLHHHQYTELISLQNLVSKLPIDLNPKEFIETIGDIPIEQFKPFYYDSDGLYCYSVENVDYNNGLIYDSPDCHSYIFKLR